MLILHGVDGAVGGSVGSTGMGVPVAGGSVGVGGSGVGGSVGGTSVYVGSGVTVCSSVGEGTGETVTVVGMILVGVFVALGVSVPVGAGVYVEVMGGSSCFPRVAVGGIEDRVGVVAAVNVKTGFKVTTAEGLGVAVSLPVTGRKIGPTGLGIASATICLARAMAVLFILANDRSWVLRACRSMAVGGVGLMLASTNTIHPMPEQSRRTKMA